MQWQDVCQHPSLRDLPFRIELNEWGQVLMSPVKVYHSAFQGAIARLLPASGVVLSECAIRTAKGTRVADIAWCSEPRFRIIQPETECSIAPEICIEVMSSGNTADDMADKRQLYLAAGALEFWICDETGAMRFFDGERRLERSLLIPAFPDRVRILA